MTPRMPPAWRLPFFALCCCLATAFATRVASAQDSVTATSGSPAAIARVRAEFTAIERAAPRYRHTTHDLEGFSLEGGTLDGLYDGAELRKLSARHFGEMWRGRENFYFSGGRLIFIHVVHERYDEPMSGRIQLRVEHRFYFDDHDRLIRLVRTARPSRSADDLSSYDPKLADLLATAKLFAACAAAEGSDESVCTAPSSP